MMPILGFNHYNIRAERSTMELLKVFYRDVIGLTLGDRPNLSSFGYWLYIGNKDILHLSEAKPEEGRQENVATTFDHIAFTATDYFGTLERLDQLGVEYKTREIQSLGQKQVFLRDPAGNGIELNFR
jgi:catechol 2,3-dioxygenase-like lactoylglutathione lyase family enzyme